MIPESPETAPATQGIGMRAGLKGLGAAKLRRRTGVLVLAFACGAASAARAGTYYVSNYTELANAVTAANASPDPSSIIILTQNISVTGPLSSPSKNLTIDTRGFTITESASIPGTLGSHLTLQGSFKGTDVLGPGAGGAGFSQTSQSNRSVITNNGSITGGSSQSVSGGAGVSLSGGGGMFVNNGKLTGGFGDIAGGSGLTVSEYTVVNSGTIEGGSTAGFGGGGVGVDLGGPSGGSASSLTNSGTIRGGFAPNNGYNNFPGGIGVAVRNSNSPIVNSGLIEGWSSSAIVAVGETVSLNIVNSGTIRIYAPGEGRTQVAIGWASGITPTTGSLTLELQAGSVIEGKVVANASGGNDVLRLGGSGDWTLDGGIGSAGQYQNFDRLEKTGSSTWTVNGSGDFSGSTTISEGGLIVNGSLANSAVTVQSGARLGGSGTVGATTVTSGGRITPGNSIGTLTVNGTYVQNAGAVYEVELDPRTASSDRIDVKGTATLANGATISVVNATGAAYVAGQRFTILTSTGLSGSYGNGDLALTPFLTLRNSTDPTNAYLTVVQTLSIASLGITANEISIGRAIDNLPGGNLVLTGLTNAPTIEAARGELGYITGEIHASAGAVLIQESWQLHTAVNDRLRAAFGSVGATPMATLSYGFTADLSPAATGPMPKPPAAERFAAWGQGYGSWGRTGSDGNAASLSRSTGGFLVGADAAVFENLRLGIVAGYSRTTFSVNSRLSSGESGNYHLGLYGGGQWGALGLRLGASYTWHDLTTRRGVVAPGLGDVLHADYAAGTAQGFGELGYRVDLGQTVLGRVALEPFAGLAYVVLRTEGFFERGGAAALTSYGNDTSLGYATLGLRAATTARLAGMDVTLRGGLGWRHAFGDVDPKAVLAFAGGNPFSISGLPIARNAALVEAGLDVALGSNTTLGASYTAQLANDTQDHAFKASLAVRF